MRNFVEMNRFSRFINYLPGSKLTNKRVNSFVSTRQISYHLEKYKKTFAFAQQQKAYVEDCYLSYWIKNVKQLSTSSVTNKSKDKVKSGKKSQSVQNIDYNEMNEVIDSEKLTQKFENALNNMKNNFVKFLSLRTSAGAIEELPVTYEGKQYVLQEVVQISRKPKLLALNVSMFPQFIPTIIQTLSNHKMNLNPQQDGTMIYITIPKVTKEYREDLSKSAKSYYIKCRDEIKEIRNKEIKKMRAKEKLSVDTSHRVQGYIEILGNQYISKAEKILDTKQKELLGESE